MSARNNSKEFATVSSDSTIRVWNIDTGHQSLEFFAEGDQPNCVKWQPDEPFLICGFQSGTVRVFDTVIAKSIVEVKLHGAEVCAIDFHRGVLDKEFVVSADSSGCFIVSELQAGLSIFTKFQLNVGCQTANRPLIAFSISKKFLAIGCGKVTEVMIINTNDWTSICSLGNINLTNLSFQATTKSSLLNSFGNKPSSPSTTIASNESNDLLGIYFLADTNDSILLITDKHVLCIAGCMLTRNKSIQDGDIDANGLKTNVNSGQTSNFMKHNSMSTSHNCMGPEAVVSKRIDVAGGITALSYDARTNLLVFGLESKSVTPITTNQSTQRRLSVYHDEKLYNSFALLSIRVEASEGKLRMVMSDPQLHTNVAGIAATILQHNGCVIIADCKGGMSFWTIKPTFVKQLQQNLHFGSVERENARCIIETNDTIPLLCSESGVSNSSNTNTGEEVFMTVPSSSNAVDDDDVEIAYHLEFEEEGVEEEVCVDSGLSIGPTTDVNIYSDVSIEPTGVVDADPLFSEVEHQNELHEEGEEDKSLSAPEIAESEVEEYALISSCECLDNMDTFNNGKLNVESFLQIVRSNKSRWENLNQNLQIKASSLSTVSLSMQRLLTCCVSDIGKSKIINCQIN
jgi:hypothetical protein